MVILYRDKEITEVLLFKFVIHWFAGQQVLESLCWC
jgi:hypothetical protein